MCLALSFLCGPSTLMATASSSSDSAVPSDRQALGIWACSTCTYHNSVSLPACAMCLAPRDSKASPTIFDDPQSQENPTQKQPIRKKAKSPQKTAENLNGNNVGRKNHNNNNVIDLTSESPEKSDQQDEIHNSDDGWSCYRCSYLNQPMGAECEICEAPRLNSPLSSSNSNAETILQRKLSAAGRLDSLEENGDIWDCSNCTFQNIGDSKNCEACHTPKDENADGAAGASSTNCIPDRSVPDFARQQSENMDMLRLVDENSAREVWDNIVTFCKEKEENFVDPSFPPADKSIGVLDGQYQGPFEWLRPQEICTRDGRLFRWSLFKDPPLPTDIQQGALGNCWFLSALAVISERPDLLKHIVVTQEYSKYGVYQIRLNIDGQWRVVLVDDCFPCHPTSKLLAFSEGRRNQLWVPLIEKALAKVFGTYAALSSGRSIEGLAILTGAPCESISLEEALGDGSGNDSSVFEESFGMDVTWAKLLSCREAKFLMGASCGAGHMPVDEAVYQSVGLFTKHAYSILDVQTACELRLVKLRNPWGGGVNWNGDFSDFSPLWTNELRQRLMPEGPRQQEGVFWMPFSDFYRYFDTVDICKVRDGWNEVRLGIEFPPDSKSNNFRAIRLIVTEPTEIDLILYQECFRHENSFARGLVDLCIILGTEARTEGMFGEYVNSSRRRVTNFVNVNQVMKPGSYLVVCGAFNHWGRTMGPDEFPRGVVTVHSAKPVLVEKFRAEPVLLADALISTVLRRGTKHSSTGPCGLHYLTQGFGGLVVMAENYTENHCIQVRCDASESQNVVSTRGTLVTHDVIPPLHRQILIVLSQLEGSAPYYVMHKLMHKINGKNGLGDWSRDAPAANHMPPLTEEVGGLHVIRPMFIG